MSTVHKPESQTIVVDYELSAPPEKVWRALTEPELLGRWLMDNDIRAEVGHRFTFHAQPVPGWDGVVRCEVLEVRPYERLSYTWRGGSDEREGYGAPLDSVVTWTLAPSPDGGTRLRLEHAGFTPKNAYAYENMRKGWGGKVAERMEEVLAAV